MNIGEILDRAISTFARHFVPLFVLLGITAIPSGVLAALAQPQMRLFNTLLAQANHLPAVDTVGRNALMFRALHAITPASVLLLFVVPALLTVLSRNALFVFANGLFGGEAVSIGAAYRVSFAKWIPQIVAAMCFSVVATAVIGAISFAGIIVIFLLVLALHATGPFVIAGAAVIVTLPLIAVIFIAMAILNIAWELTSIGVALEGTSPFRALGNGFRRTFDRALFGRTIGVALAYSVVEFAGTGALLAGVALLSAIVQADLVTSVLSAVVSMLISGVLGVFMVVYAHDLRIRREGLDLLLIAGS